MHEMIWCVNMTTRQGSIEPVPDSWKRLGGRGLIPRILLDEIDPMCDPLGPDNKLIWASGLLVGHRISSCDRISIGAKSPLTGGIKESNAGGTTGYLLAQLGIKALILDGMPVEDSWWVIHVSADGIRFDPAEDFVGLGVYDCAAQLMERYGSGVGCSLIGPGGEMQLRTAGIQNLDKDDVPSRINGRGGMGAVMGSKRVKALVIDASGGEKPPLADPALFKEAQKRYTKDLLAHPQTKSYADYGTAALTGLCDRLGALPTRNFSAGTFEAAEKIGGENLRDLLLERGGNAKTTHACMPGCAIRCSNVFTNVQDEIVVSPIEYETIGLMGSNLGIDSLDIIARMNWEANDLGLDSIDIGAALGVAAEAGLMSFGDGEKALELLNEIRRGTSLGRILGNGAAVTGQVLGVRRVPVVKGQAIGAYDPRAIKGTGVTYATSPQGADHTAGLTIRAKVKHLEPDGQAKLSRKAQINMAGYDTLGVCIFAGFGFAVSEGAVRDLVRSIHGWDVADDILQRLGEETLKLEVAFNRAAGFTAADDRLPEWITEEPLPPHNTVFDVSAADLDGVHAEADKDMA
jgi:aldehyde:ferredoxin oxidoreductase